MTSSAPWTSQCSAALPDLLLLPMFHFHTVALVSHMLGRRSLSSSGRRYMNIGWEATHKTSSKHTAGQPHMSCFQWRYSPLLHMCLEVDLSMNCRQNLWLRWVYPWHGCIEHVPFVYIWYIVLSYSTPFEQKLHGYFPVFWTGPAPGLLIIILVFLVFTLRPLALNSAFHLSSFTPASHLVQLSCQPWLQGSQHRAAPMEAQHWNLEIALRGQLQKVLGWGLSLDGHPL